MTLKHNDNQLNLKESLTHFFKHHQCHVTASNNSISIQLTEEMDLYLMNRPFYWQYMKSIGQQGEPKSLTLTFSNSCDDGEWIHYGSPRLQQIYKYLQQHSKYTKLYEEVKLSQNIMLHPWLVTNFCIEYTGKQKKEELISIGLNLINGVLMTNMMEKLNNIKLNQTISNHCFKVTPLIKLKSGFTRIENYIEQHIIKQNHDWAIEAIDILNEEIDMMYHFYKNNKNNEAIEKEKADIMARIQPKISYQVWNGGLFYLTEKFHEQYITS